MRNHFHLVVETPNANLVEGMRWLLSAYTIRLNHRHQLVGHVFSGRYKALLVDGSGSGYLKSVCDYVHLNPVRAKLLAREERLLAYPWSSLVWYLAAGKHRPEWVRVDRLLGEHGIAGNSASERQEFERRMEERRLEEGDAEGLQMIRRGWFIGSKAFKEQMLEFMKGKLGEDHAGELRLETAESKDAQILSEELGRLGWSEEELARRRKSDPEKLAIAGRLRRETTLTVKRIAARLHMGTRRSANVRLHQWLRANPVSKSGRKQTSK